MAATSPHKARRKPRKSGNEVSFASETIKHGDGRIHTRSKKAANSLFSGGKPEYPLAAFLWSARGTSQWTVLPIILMVVGLFRWAAGLWGYSGFQTPPMYGDFEAQRHWMEITTQLPISQWYFHDPRWWGLDYPPLTAYHSWVMGKIGALIDPEWFQLYTSRGIEGDQLKVFMRATVLISEYLVYIPAAVIFVRRFSRLQGVQSWDASIALVAILMQPGLILIDHVHFQYNTVMLGLVLASASSIMAGRYMWSCVFFVGALGFKQMALYYAPAIFAYLLGICIFPKLNFPRFVRIGAVTGISFAILIFPIVIGALLDYRHSSHAIPEAALDGKAPVLPVFGFLAAHLNHESWNFPVVQQLTQMIHRVFPFARGLFEDKVANVWCAMNTVIKLRQYPQAMLQRISLVATLVSIFPACIIIFLRPRKELLPLALAMTAWGFFLLSFQVHEKSVLLPLMPMTVLLASKDGLSGYKRSWIGFANILGAWTMFPLLQRVELRMPYTVLTLLWAYLLDLPPVSFGVYKGMSFDKSLVEQSTVLVHIAFYLFMVVWHGVEAYVKPPVNLPDLWVVANVTVGAVGFGLCYLWCLGSLVVESQILKQAPKRTLDKGKKKQ